MSTLYIMLSITAPIIMKHLFVTVNAYLHIRSISKSGGLLVGGGGGSKQFVGSTRNWAVSQTPSFCTLIPHTYLTQILLPPFRFMINLLGIYYIHSCFSYETAVLQSTHIAMLKVAFSSLPFSAAPNTTSNSNARIGLHTVCR